MLSHDDDSTASDTLPAPLAAAAAAARAVLASPFRMDELLRQHRVATAQLDVLNRVLGPLRSPRLSPPPPPPALYDSPAPVGKRVRKLLQPLVVAQQDILAADPLRFNHPWKRAEYDMVIEKMMLDVMQWSVDTYRDTESIGRLRLLRPDARFYMFHCVHRAGQAFYHMLSALLRCRQVAAAAVDAEELRLEAKRVLGAASAVRVPALKKSRLSKEAYVDAMRMRALLQRYRLSLALDEYDTASDGSLAVHTTDNVLAASMSWNDVPEPLVVRRAFGFGGRKDTVRFEHYLVLLPYKTERNLITALAHLLGEAPPAAPAPAPAPPAAADTPAHKRCRIVIEIE
jgi:hypothetical protein